MGKSIIANKLGSKNFNVYLPADATTANTFATTFLDGEFAVYEMASTAGNDTGITSYFSCTAVCTNMASGAKSYINLALKSTMTEEDVITGLMGLTFNGALTDAVSVINMQLMTVAA